MSSDRMVDAEFTKGENQRQVCPSTETGMQKQKQNLGIFATLEGIQIDKMDEQSRNG
jgi:hypothetical protein